MIPFHRQVIAFLLSLEVKLRLFHYRVSLFFEEEPKPPRCNVSALPLVPQKP